MSIFSWYGGPRCAPRSPQARPGFEGLEGRQLPSATISGYVFNDVNNDGQYQPPGDQPLNGSTLLLYRGATTSGAPVASAVSGNGPSGVAGFYQFTTDGGVSQVPTKLTKVVTFAPAKTGWTKSAQVAQFDPSLGTLLSVQIVNMATLQTEFSLQSFDNEPAMIGGSVNGNVTLSVPGLGPITAQVSASDSFNAAAFDAGAYPDSGRYFQGASGHDSGVQTHSGSQSLTISQSDPRLAAFAGTGTLSLSAHAGATSSVTGPGNVLGLVSATAGAQVQVIYTYVPSNALKPGTYTIVQVPRPAVGGNIAGLKSSGGRVLRDGTNSITVTLGNGNAADNDFGELKPSSLSGRVYLDRNKNGVRDAADVALPGVYVTLMGSDFLGRTVHLVTLTGGDGSYNFTAVAPGSYTIIKTPPAGYVGSSINAGTLNGAAAPVGTVHAGDLDHFFLSNLAQGQVGQDFDFGEQLRPTTPQTTPPYSPPATPPSLSKVLFLSSTLRGHR